MEPLHVNTLFSIHPKVVYTLIDDEMVLMGADTETLYGLNPVGTEIIKQLESTALSLQTINDHITQQFEIDPEVSLIDISTFLQALLVKQLIIRSY